MESFKNEHSSSLKMCLIHVNLDPDDYPHNIDQSLYIDYRLYKFKWATEHREKGKKRKGKQTIEDFKIAAEDNYMRRIYSA